MKKNRFFFTSILFVLIAVCSLSRNNILSCLVFSSLSFFFFVRSEKKEETK